MSSKLKWIIPVVVILVVLLGYMFFHAASTPSSKGNAKGVLNVWGVFENSDNMQPFIAAYQKNHPGVSIIYTEKSVDTYEQDLINALASGNGPDIFEIHNDWLPKYQDKLTELPSQILTLKDYENVFVDAAKNDFVSNGKAYAIPLTVDSLALYYNKDILGAAGIATPPATWADLKADVRKITKLGGSGTIARSGVAMGTTSNINRAVDIMYLLLLQNNGVYYTPDFTQSTLDQSVQDNSGNTIFPAISALNFYTSFSNPTSDVYTWNQNSNYSIDAFANGQLAFLYGYSFTLATIQQKAPNLNFGIANVPQPDAESNPVNFANYWGFAVSKQSTNPALAWDFIKSMATKDSLTSYYQRHNQPSSRRDIIGTQISDPQIGPFAYANLTAKTFYKRDQGKVDNIITNMIDDVVIRGKGIQESVSSATQQINLLNR